MFNKITGLVKVLFSKPIDTSTEEGRRKERARKIAQSAAMGMVAKLLNVLSGLITVPITLPYLGVEQFGIWMALTGFVAFLVFSDFGLSIGLKSCLAKTFAENDQSKAGLYISTTFVLLVGIAFVLALFTVLIITNIDLQGVIKLQSIENQDVLQNTAVTLLIIFSLGMPSAVIHRTLEAYQLGAIANSAIAIGRLFSLFSIFLCVYTNQSLTVMASFYMGLPLLSMYICGFWMCVKNKWMRPSVSKYNKICAGEIFAIGKLALSAQLGASMMSTGPLLVLSSVFGAAAITPYAITKRMFDAVTMVLSEFLYPLWPAYGEAAARNDFKWIKETFKKSVVMSLMLFLPIFVLLSFIGQDVIYLWSHDTSAVPSWFLLMVCNIWTLLLLLVRILSMFLNGLNQFKGQAVYGLILPFLALLSGWLMSDSIGMPLSILLMIFVGELLRILFMSIEVKGMMTKFNKKIDAQNKVKF